MLYLFLFWFLGVLIHLAFKFKSAYARKDFNINTFVKKNVVGSILSLLCGVPCVLLKDDIFEMFGILLTNLNAFLLGYAGDSGFKKLIGKGKSLNSKKLD